MPNWCSTSMAVVGPKNDLILFKNFVANARKNAKANGKFDLYQLFADLGLSEEQILNGNCGYNRGSIDGDPYFAKFRDGSDSEYLQVDYDSAWGPMIEGFDYILQERFPTLKGISIAEECGCEVFINQDKYRKIWPWNWNIDGETPDGRYVEEHAFKTEQEAVDYLNSLGVKCSSLKEAEEIASEWEDGYLSINEYCDY